VVKVELELPENVWRALTLVAEKFDETPDEWAASCIRMQLDACADNEFMEEAQDYFRPLSLEVKRLLSGDPCEDCVVDRGSPDCEGCPHRT